MTLLLFVKLLYTLIELAFVALEPELITYKFKLPVAVGINTQYFAPLAAPVLSVATADTQE